MYGPGLLLEEDMEPINSSWASGVKMLKLVEVLVSCVASFTRVRYHPPIPSQSRVLSFGGVHVNDPEFEMLSVSLAVSISKEGWGEPTQDGR